jgi:hypothetical protein
MGRETGFHNMPLPQLHLLTCAPRKQSCMDTLLRLAHTDWPVKPRVHVDSGTETAAATWGTSARAPRLTEAFATMLRTVLAAPGPEQEWLLFLEDDLDFHPQLAAHVGVWQPLWDPACAFASLFNPSLRRLAIPYPLPHSFAADPAGFLGAQALLLRRASVRTVLQQWPTLTGMTSQRLAKLFGARGPIWVHDPSLVQHVAEDSSWGTRVQKALDFNPAWKPKKPAFKGFSASR